MITPPFDTIYFHIKECNSCGVRGFTGTRETTPNAGVLVYCLKCNKNTFWKPVTFYMATTMKKAAALENRFKNLHYIQLNLEN
jgi:hypothetical protein